MFSDPLTASHCHYDRLREMKKNNQRSSNHQNAQFSYYQMDNDSRSWILLSLLPQCFWNEIRSWSSRKGSAYHTVSYTTVFLLSVLRIVLFAALYGNFAKPWYIRRWKVTFVTFKTSFVNHIIESFEIGNYLHNFI